MVVVPSFVTDGHAGFKAFLGGGRDSARLIRFCGLTRIMPWRGESMSAMSMNAIETISGRIGSNLDPALTLREP